MSPAGSAGAAIPTDPRRSPLFAVLAVVVVDLIGFGIVMPVLPFYAEEYGADATTLGWLFTCYAGAQFVFAPLWGRLSDRVGRRPVMLTTVAGTSLALLVLGLSDSLTGLFVARVLGGVFAANVSVASAYVADATDESERTRWMGLLGASFGVGFVLGPAIGGLLSPWGYAVPMLAASGLAAANFVHALVSLREPPRREHGAGQEAPAAARAAVLREPLVRRLCGANLLFALAVTQLETLFAFYMLARFGWDAREVAFILVGMAVVMGGVQGGGMKRLAARFGERTLVTSGCALLACGFALLPEAPSVAVLLLPLALAAVGRAVAQPSLMSMTSVAAQAESRGAVMGAFQGAASLARVLGPIAAGWLFDRARPAPFWLAAALALTVALAARGLPQAAGSGDA